MDGETTESISMTMREAVGPNPGFLVTTSVGGPTNQIIFFIGKHFCPDKFLGELAILTNHYSNFQKTS